MCGRATLTIVTSSTTANWERASTTRVAQGLRRMGSSGSPRMVTPSAYDVHVQRAHTTSAYGVCLRCRPGGTVGLRRRLVNVAVVKPTKADAIVPARARARDREPLTRDLVVARAIALADV